MMTQDNPNGPRRRPWGTSSSAAIRCWQDCASCRQVAKDRCENFEKQKIADTCAASTISVRSFRGSRKAGQRIDENLRRPLATQDASKPRAGLYTLPGRRA
jgi:hypothetical protein